MPADPILADRLYRSTVGMLGSGEHLQIAGLLREASRTVICKEAALDLRAMLDADPWSIECNLDAILPPERAAWYEWPLGTRSGHGGGDQAVTGCLVAPHPEAEGVMTIVTGWQAGNGPARHAFAVSMVDLGQMYGLAWGARNRFSQSPDESIERIMSCVATHMPEGFADEVGILTDGSAEAVEAAMRDATSEIPFLLALLVAMRSNGGLAVSQNEGHGVASFSPPLRRGPLARAARKMLGRPSTGFKRHVRRGTLRLSLYRA